MDCFRKAIQFDAQYSAAYSNLGWASQNSNDMTAAITNYHKALQLDPTDEVYRKNFNSALEYFRKMQKTPKGLEDYIDGKKSF